MYRNTYFEINLDALADNFKNIKNELKDYKYYIAVVKSNCYGHGSYSINALIKAGANYLAISNLLEAENIRKINKTIPIICLEPINLEYIKKAQELNIILTVSSLEYLKKLKNLNDLDSKNIKIHLKINSGMNRLGFNDKLEVEKAVSIINKNFILEGVYSHFHSLGITDEYYDKQVNNFLDITSLIDLKKVKMIHFSRSSSVVNHEKLPFCNSVRLGAILYGIDVSIKEPKNLRKIKNNLIRKFKKISKVTYENNISLKNALSFYSEVIEINFVKKDSYIGYGLNYKLEEDSHIAVVCAGYSDGLKQNDTNRHVIINDKKYLIVGKVCAGMFMIKVSNEVKVGDKVTIYGENLNIKSIARNAKASEYDLYSSLHEAIPRIYIENKKEIYKEIWEVK